MRLEKRFLIIALIAIVLAVPVTLALQHWSRQVKIEKSQNSNLQLQLNSKQHDLELKSQQIQDKQKANDELQKQLQSKRDAATTLAQAHPAPVVTSGTGSCEAYRGLVTQYDWPINTAMAIMHAESNCNPIASSPTCDHGLMQINCVHRAAVGGDLALLNDPATNVRVAYAIYAAAGGWTPWTTYTSGAYLRYL